MLTRRMDCRIKSGNDRCHVMPGFTPGIHVFSNLKETKAWMGRDKPGHDDRVNYPVA